MLNKSSGARSPKQPKRIRRAALGTALGIALAGWVVAGCSSSSPEATSPPSRSRPTVPVLEAIAAYSVAHPVNTEDPRWKTKVPQPPVVQFDRSKHYFWYLHTSEGVLKIELKPEWAPRRVAATIYLTKLGFYNGLKFHRIIPKFMVQGGDPLGNGRGSPGFRPYASEIHRKAKHSKRGVVAMANSGPRTEGSQFYIAFDKAEHLDGKHTIFGQVVGGLGTLRALEGYGAESGEPRKDVFINRAEVRVE